MTAPATWCPSCDGNGSHEAACPNGPRSAARNAFWLETAQQVAVGLSTQAPPFDPATGSKVGASVADALLAEAIARGRL